MRDIIKDYADALALRRAARKAAFEAYRERKQRIERIERIEHNGARRAARPFPARLMSREEFYDPNN